MAGLVHVIFISELDTIVPTMFSPPEMS